MSFFRDHLSSSLYILCGGRVFQLYLFRSIHWLRRSLTSYHGIFDFLSWCKIVNGFSEGLQLQPGIEYLLRHINSKIESLPLWPPLLFLRIIWFNFHEICRIKLRKTCAFWVFFFFFHRGFCFWEGYCYLIQKFNNYFINYNLPSGFCCGISRSLKTENWTGEFGNFDMQNHGGNLSQCHWHSCLGLYICLWTNHESHLIPTWILVGPF